MHNQTMQINGKSEGVWKPRAVAFLIAALVAASGTYWILQWPDAAVSRVAPETPATAAPTEPTALARLLGSGNPAASAVSMGNAANRFVLMGVVADTSSGGVALISVDGKPARPFLVGRRVDDNLILQSVTSRHAVLAASSNSPAALTLEMKPLPK